MTAPWLKSLADDLTAAGYGAQGDTVFVGMLNDTNQTQPVITLTRFKGTTRETMGDAGTAIDIPMLQIGVLAPTYDAAETAATNVRNRFKAVRNAMVQGTYFLRLMPEGTLKDVGRDAKGRQRFTFEFEVWINGE